MRQFVERVADLAGPAVGDLERRELGKRAQQFFGEMRIGGGGSLIDKMRHSSTPDDAIFHRDMPEIREGAVGVAVHSPCWHQFVEKNFRQRLRRDDGRAHRHHPAVEIAVKVARIAIGRDNDMARPDRALRGLEVEAVALGDDACN